MQILIVALFLSGCASLTPIVPYVEAAKGILDEEILKEEVKKEETVRELKNKYRKSNTKQAIPKAPKEDLSKMACLEITKEEKKFLRGYVFTKHCVCKKLGDFAQLERNNPPCVQ